MKLSYYYIIAFLLTVQIGTAQESFTNLLQRHNTQVIPYISVQELAMPKTNAVIFDARELEEYTVSHLKNAIHVGYNHFKKDVVQENIKNKNQLIVVYCSIGIRSENISVKLKKMGYTNIYNLYGGIFEWKNKEFPVYNTKDQETENVHAFSKPWSKWLKRGNKVY